jgi:hypothetical protein
MGSLENAPPAAKVSGEEIMSKAHSSLDELKGVAEEQKKQFNEIVYGTNVKTGSKVDLKGKEAATEAVPTTEEVTAAFKNKEYGKAIKMFFNMLFSSKMSARKEGLSHFAEFKEQIPPREMLGLINQLEHADPSMQTVLDKRMSGIVNGELRRKLTKEYKAAGVSEAKTFHDAAAETSVEDILKAQPKGAEVIAELKKTEGEEKPLILGTLSLNAKIPAGARVFFDESGYPIWMSFQKLDPKNVKPVTIYRRKEAKDIVDKSRNEETMEALKATLKDGDILLTSPNRKPRGGYLHPFSWLISKAVDKETAGSNETHALYFDGTNIQHMNPKGWETQSSEDAFLTNGEKNRYKSVTILRVPDASVKQFAENTKKRVDAYKSNPNLKYGTDWKKIGKNNVAGTVEHVDDGNEDTAICTDAVTEGANGVGGLDDFANRNVPSDLFKARNVRVIASFEFDR